MALNFVEYEKFLSLYGLTAIGHYVLTKIRISECNITPSSSKPGMGTIDKKIRNRYIQHIWEKKYTKIMVDM